MKNRTLLGIGTLIAAGCGNANGSQPDAGSSAAALSFTATPVTLVAGGEKVVCWDFVMPKKLGVTGVHVALPPVGTHHYGLTIANVSAKNGAYDCTVAPGGMNATPIGIGGPGAEGVTFPEGTALDIDANSVLTLQLHLLNASGSTLVADAARVDLDGVDDSSGMQPVGFLASFTNDIDLPPHTYGIEVHTGCTTKNTLDNVFDSYLHMHTRGKTIAIDITAPGGDKSSRVLEESHWDFEHQKIYSLAASVAAGSKFDLTCRYDNDTDKEIVSGPLSSNEMCGGGLYYYPASKPRVVCGAQ